MTNIRAFLRKIGAYGGTFTAGLTLESYFRGLRKDLRQDPTIADLMERNSRKDNYIKELLDDKIDNLVDKTKMEGHAEQAKSSMEFFKRKVEVDQKVSEGLKDNSLSEENKAVLQNEMDINTADIKTELKKMDDTLDSIIQILNQSKPGDKLVDIDTIWEYLGHITSAIDQLSLEQKGALINVLAVVVLFTFVTSLIGAIAGDRILEYFRLEQRLPWLSKVFVVRRKLQWYSFIWNSLYIYVILLIIFLFNLFVIFKDYFLY